MPRPISDPAIPAKMAAVLLTGHGGFEMLDYRTDVPVPMPAREEVLIRVAAAGVNNTDINTRIGWYSKSVTGDTDEAATTTSDGVDDDGGWAGKPIVFPRIQGADVCGRIVAVGADVDLDRLDERVIVATMQRAPTGDRPLVTETMGSEFDGGFAQYLVAHRAETHRIECDWSDIELASIPCAYSTAENMLHRIGVGRGDSVLVTGASGGVGSAAVQLAKRRGASVIAVSGAAKAAAITELGADHVVHRGTDLVEELGAETIDVVVDLVAGPAWPRLLDVLRRGGRYITSGAIAGPIVELDVRTLYLKDLRLEGATYQEAGVFENLIGYIERGEIRPIVAEIYPLSEIVRAQQDFLAKKFVGKLVLVPPNETVNQD